MELNQTIHAGENKSKLRSLAEVTLAGMMLKTYMAMSNLWLLADKLKKANNNANAYAKSVKAAQPVLKTQL